MAPDSAAYLCTRREVSLRASLQDDASAELADVGHLGDVLPDVERQDERQAGEHLVGAPAELLEIDLVLLHEDRAAVMERGGDPGVEGVIRELLERDVELLGHALEEVAVAGRALGVEPEVLDPAVLEEDDLDVLAAHVADDVDLAVVLLGAEHVGDGLDDRRVERQGLFQDPLGVARRTGADDLHVRTLIGGPPVELSQDSLRVLERVARREHVDAAQELSRLVEQHGLGGGGAAVDAQVGAHRLARLELPGLEHGHRVLLDELPLLLLAADQRRPALSAARELVDPVLLDELVEALERARIVDRVHGVRPRIPALVIAVVNGADGREVLRILRAVDEVLDGHVPRLVSALAPGGRHLVAPALHDPGEEAVGPAEQDHPVAQDVAPRQHLQVLLHDGAEERCHDLGLGDAHLEQADDVRLREDAALGSDPVEPVRVEPDARGLLRRDARLDQDPVDGRPGASGALVVHRDDGALAAVRVRLPDDDLGVLAAQLDDRARVRVVRLDEVLDGVDLLDERRAEHRHEGRGARSRDEEPEALPGE
jgi:hypothetical protein